MDERGPEQDEPASSTRNEVNGPVSGNLVQAGWVTGGVHFHQSADAVPPPPPRRDPWLVLCGLLCIPVPVLGAFLVVVLTVGGLPPTFTVRDFAQLGVPAIVQVAIGHRLLGARRQAVWGSVLAGSLPLWITIGIGHLAYPATALALCGPVTVAALLAATRVLRGGHRRRQWSTAVAGVAGAVWFAVDSPSIVEAVPTSGVLLWILVVAVFLAEVAFPALVTVIGPGRSAAWVLTGWVLGAGIAFAIDILLDEVLVPWAGGSYLLAVLLRVGPMTAMVVVGVLLSTRGRPEIR
ncbi:hypothetical protein AB0K14_21195 [Actinosynnema sp. NPDC050801]|uniref:hypothetical protein n=1 Tax=unclassified Actinosynnema TaxID=2637065 RepID=UPI0033C456A6